MDWARVKTILIVFFLLINVLLAGILWTRELQSENIVKQTHDKLVEILSRRGLELDGVKIPDDTSYTYDLPRDNTAEMNTAVALLGLVQSEEILGGNYSYTCETGVARFRPNGVFEIMPDAPVPLTASNVSESVLNLAKMINFIDDAQVAPVREAVQVTESGVFLYPYIQGLPLWNAYAEFSLNGGGVAKISGRWLSGKPKLSSDSPCHTAQTALLILAESEFSTGLLQSISLGYFSEPVSPSVVRLTPVWKLEFEANSYYVNGVTNEIEPI